MIPLHLSNPVLVSLVREMLHASVIFPSHLEMFSRSLAPWGELHHWMWQKRHMNLTSLAFVELYLPAQMGDFLARARSPPNESTSSFNVAFMSPLLAPFFPDFETCKTQGLISFNTDLQDSTGNPIFFSAECNSGRCPCRLWELQAYHWGRWCCYNCLGLLLWLIVLIFDHPCFPWSYSACSASSLSFLFWAVFSAFVCIFCRSSFLTF